jgi:hypothetical protein
LCKPVVVPVVVADAVPLGKALVALVVPVVVQVG